MHVYIILSHCRDVDYDEMAWELEKCLTYHFISPTGKNQMIMNEEATMARRGLGK